MRPRAPRESRPDDFTLHGLLRPAILLTLRDRAGHGYELADRVAEIGVGVPVAVGGLYRALRAMDAEGLVESDWTTPERGPARRVYSITDAGERYLEESIPELTHLVQTMKNILNRYRSLDATTDPSGSGG